MRSTEYISFFFSLKQSFSGVLRFFVFVYSCVLNPYDGENALLCFGFLAF